MVEKDKANETYIVPAPLVHKAILSIIGGILAIGTYMVLWAISYAGTVAREEARVDALERNQVNYINHLDGHPQRVEDQIENLRRRMERMEDAN